MARTFSDTALLLKAIAFAAEKHRHQRRKDPAASPYINHPIALADLLLHEAGVHDVTTLCAAVLHDTLEDTQTTLHELQDQFGSRIARVVQEVTDNKQLPKGKRKELQIKRAHMLSSRARLVKLADKICNLRDLAEATPRRWSRRRKAEYFDWARTVIRAIGPVDSRLNRLFDEVYRKRPHLGRWTRHSKPSLREPAWLAARTVL